MDQISQGAEEVGMKAGDERARERGMRHRGRVPRALALAQLRRFYQGYNKVKHAKVFDLVL